MKRKFTLIELVVVIAILSLLFSILIPNVKDMKDDAIVANMKNSIRILQTVTDIYALEHNGEYPTLSQPTIEEPQKLNFDLLYPKYIKNKPPENMRYWVDYSGHVWGATIEAPSNFFESDQYIEWTNDINAVKYRVYEIADEEQTSKVEKRRIVDVETIFSENADIVQLEKKNKTFLVSGIDMYDFETAPVGLTYKELQEWFTPILSEEGEFVFEIIREKNMIFDGYSVKESKPPGTSITYDFASEKDNFTNYEKDITKLPPSKHLKIRITTKSYNGKYPSLYNMNIYFHFENEKVQKAPITPIPQNSIPPFIQKNYGTVFYGEINNDEKIYKVYRPVDANEMEIWYGVVNDGEYTWKKASSLKDVPSNSAVYIWVDTEYSYGSGGSSEEEGEYSTPNIPTVVTKPNPTVKEVKIEDRNQSEDEKWETIQTMTFLVSADRPVKWLYAEYDHEIPEGTRIQYLFSSGDGLKWSDQSEDVAQLPQGQIVKIIVKLQRLETLEDKTIKPKVNSIRLYHDEGSATAHSNKPTVIFSDNRNTYEVGEFVSWDFEAVDPMGLQITNVEWSANKKDYYATTGDYTVGVRVQNSAGIWSDWVYKTFTVTPLSFTTKERGSEPYYFAGSDRTYIGRDIDKFPTKTLTLEFVTKRGIAKQGNEYIFSYAVSGQHNEVAINSNSGKLSYGIQNEYTTTTISLKPNEYHHYAMTINRDTGLVQIYEDGQLVWTKTHQIPRDFKSTGVIFLGQDQDTLGGKLDSLQSLVGFLDEVRVWNVILTQSQINSLVNKTVTNNPPSLVYNLSSTRPDKHGEFIFERVQSIPSSTNVVPYFYPESDSYFKVNETAFPKTKFTATMWVKQEVISSSKVNPIISYATSSNANSLLINNQTNNAVRVHIMNTYYQSSVVIPLNTWTHIAVSWDSSTGALKIYKDGKLEDQSTLKKGTSIPASGCLILGQDQDSLCGSLDSTQAFGGTMKEVNIYSSVLTDAQIKAIYNRSSIPTPTKQYIPYSMTLDQFYSQQNKYNNIGFEIE